MSGVPDPGGGVDPSVASSKPIRPPIRDAGWSSGSGSQQPAAPSSVSAAQLSTASTSPSLANKGAALSNDAQPPHAQQPSTRNGSQSARLESGASQQSKSAQHAQKQKAAGSAASSSAATVAPATAAAAAAPKPLPHNYKTVACRYWAKSGSCPKGDLCTYIHGPSSTAAPATEQKQSHSQPQQPKQAKQPKQQQPKQQSATSTPTGSPQQRPAPSNHLSASPIQPASARSLAANLDDSALRKEQASKLFSLLHGAASGAGSGSSSKGQPSKQHAAQPSKKPASKPAAAISSNADAGLAGFDWSKLVSGSKEEQLKSQQMRGQQRDDADDDAGEHDAAAADTQKLNQMRAQEQQTKPASSTDVAAAAPTHMSVIDEFRSKYEASKAEESRLSIALTQLAREEAQSRNGIQSPAAQALRSSISSARASLRARYIDLLSHYSPRLNVQKSVVQKLWQLLYREIEHMLTQCKNQAEKQSTNVSAGANSSYAEQYGHRKTALPGPAAAAPSGSAPDLFSVSVVEAEELLRSRLESALAAHFHTLDQVAKQVHERYPLEQKNRPTPAAASAGENESASASTETASEEKKTPSPETLLAARQILSALCVCLGDLERYRQLYILRANDAKTLAAPGSAADPWARVLFFYTRSLLLDPASPSAAKSHNQLAVVSSYAALRPSITDAFRGRTHFRSLYHYTRALLASSSPFPARQNILALYEQNRESYTSNLRPSPDNEASLLLAAFIRLWSMLDTKIALEQWAITYDFTSQALKTMLNKAFFPSAATGSASAAAAEQRLSERDMVQLMMLTLNAIDTLIAKDAAYGADPRTAPASAAASAVSAAAVTPTTLPPFHLSHLTQLALSLLYDLLGVLVRIPVLICAQSPSGGAAGFYTGRSVPFLPALALASLWIHSAFPWMLTQHESDATSMQHPGSLADRRENVRRALVGLANLLQSLETTPVPDSTVAAPEASLQELHGFAPLMRCKLWPAAAAGSSSAGSAAAAVTLDSFAFQSGCVMSLAKQVLFVHPLSMRLSALPSPPSTLSAAELADLQAQQAAWAAQRAAAATGPAKPKRPSKQAKPRPVRTTESDSATTATAADAAATSPKDAASSSSSDPSDDLVGQLDDLAVEDAGDRLFAADFTDEELVSSQSQSQGAGAAGFTAAPSFLGSTFDSSAMQLQRRLQQPQVSEMEAMMSGAGMGASAPVAASAAAAPTVSASAASTAAKLQSLSHRPLILLDGPNIAMRHGLHKSFSVRGLELALEALESQFGFRCIIFMPEFCLDYEAVGAKRRAIKAGFSDTKVTGLPDNVTLLRAWRSEGKLVTTPAQDYDDSYVIEYAMKSNALVVSNDLYRDHAVAHASSSEDRQRISQWIRAHVISFTFIEGEFFVNPAWKRDAVAGLRKIEQTHGGAGYGAASASASNYQRPMPAHPSNQAFRIMR